ncbi:alpha/beta hydrolase [Histidinibacterium lentulum]|uniref:Alpha/beta hydrolase n=1 Tax=Histidinibacterium lentulum TaxID=2480588 RepID=A0A3N2QTT2_9RHOB|nr:alpha/beta hydrolase [Histidinibacterium lentulum]ROT98549.1 alpha/beta hydrolase [Histidinibacterium lentulum]
MVETITTAAGRTLALVRTEGLGPPVLFLSGFRSDMEGTKALHLEAWAQRTGRAFVRFDYSGHGQSEGAFEEGAIGDWTEDARAVLETLGRPAILVGSSMGGWISCLLVRERPELVAGLVTIAAAPDFTEDGFWGSWDDERRSELVREGLVRLPSDYGDPLPITRRLIEDGRRHLVLRSPLRVDIPVRMLQGTADPDVSVETALRLLAHAEGGDIRLTLVKDADHRFSTPSCLAAIEAAVDEVTARLGVA